MKKLSVTLSVFELPWNYTCDGEDISPEIEVRGVDAPTMALIMMDPDAPGGGRFCHWLMWNMEPVSIIPEDIPKDPEVSFPISAVQGTNSFGRIGYSGPCPPQGEAHRYQFRVYTLDEPLDLPAGASLEELERAMDGHVVGYGDTHIRYGR